MKQFAPLCHPPTLAKMVCWILFNIVFTVLLYLVQATPFPCRMNEATPSLYGMSEAVCSPLSYSNFREDGLFDII